MKLRIPYRVGGVVLHDHDREVIRGIWLLCVDAIRKRRNRNRASGNRTPGHRARRPRGRGGHGIFRPCAVPGDGYRLTRGQQSLPRDITLGGPVVSHGTIATPRGRVGRRWRRWRRWSIVDGQPDDRLGL